MLATPGKVCSLDGTPNILTKIVAVVSYRDTIRCFLCIVKTEKSTTTMTTTFNYLNLAASLLATMITSGAHPLVPLACVVWLCIAAYIAYRDGVLGD